MSSVALVLLFFFLQVAHLKSCIKIFLINFFGFYRFLDGYRMGVNQPLALVP